MGNRMLNGSVSRRGFLKTSATLAAAGTALGTTGTLRNLKIDPAYAQTPNQEETTTLGVCSWSCSFCQYNVVVRDGHVVRTEPQEGATQRMCLKGRSKIVRMYSEERIKYPMKRVGERGENKWERITWDEAVETICAQWKKTAEEYGDLANCKYHCAGSQGMLNGNAGIMKRLFNTLGCTLFDFSFDMASAYGMIRAGLSWFDQNEGEDFVNSDYIILWGANPADANIQMWQHVANAMEAGAKLVAVDPLLSTSASKADFWVHGYPGTDAALCLGICRYLIEQEKCDYEFLRDHSCAPFIVKEDGSYLRMSDMGVEPTEGPVSPMTGKPTVVDPPAVWDKAAEAFVAVGDATDPAIEGIPEVPGFTVRGTAWEVFVEHVSEWTPEKVQEITDIPPEDMVKLADICASGKVTHYINYGSGAYDNGLHAVFATSCIPILTGNLDKPGCSVGGFDYVYGSISGNPVSFGSNGKMMKSMSILCACDVQQTGMYLGEPYPPLKNLWVTHGNLLTGNVNSNRLKKELLDPMELIVCTDIDFTETARYADIILPCADIYEYEDVVPLSHERNVRISEKAVEPPYEVMKEADIVRLFAKGFGFDDVANLTDDDWWAGTFADETAQKYGLSIEALRENKAMRYVDKQPYIGNETLRFGGESGRAQFYAEKPFQRLPNEGDFNIEFERLPRYFENTEASKVSPLKDQFPFILMSKRNRVRMHSTGYMRSWARDVNPEPIFFINPDAAQQYGVPDGAYMELYNDRGHVVGKAVYSEGVPFDLIMYPKGYQNFECVAGSLSEVTTDRYDTCAVNCSFYDNRVAIRVWDEGDN